MLLPSKESPCSGRIDNSPRASGRGAVLRRALCAIMVLFCAAAAAAESSPPDDFDFGFFASRITTPDGNSRLRILGPLYESKTATNGMSLMAIRPLCSRAEDPAEGWRKTEWLWPVASTREMGSARTSRFGPVLEADFDVNDPESRRRLWVLPFFFEGRDAKTNDYAAFFPFYGSIHEFVMFDSVDFVMFPLYVRTTRGPAESHSVLWPLVTVTEGVGISGTKVFPFYSRTAQKNMAVSKFVMWPIYSSMRYYRPDGTRGRGYVVFPFYGKLKTESDTTWMVIPPLFRYSKGQHGVKAYLPWPVVRYSSGKINAFYIWPLFGEKREKNMRSSFFLWPLVSNLHRQMGDQTMAQVTIMPFLQSRTRYESASAENEAGISADRVTARDVNLWPLFHYRGNGSTNVTEVPSLWPAASIDSVDRNYAPLWTLYTRTRQDDSVEHDLLWGLFRSRTSTLSREASLFPLVSYRSSRENEQDSMEWSLLRGILGYSRNGKERSYRFLFLRLKGRPVSSAGPGPTKED